MRFSSRLWLYGPVTLFALILIGICANWYLSSNALAEKFARWNGREMMPGVTLRYSSLETAGFPFRTDAVFKDFRIAVADRNGPVEWRAENFALHRLSYGTRTVFEAAGNQTLSWTDGKGEKRIFAFVPGRMQASSIEDKTGLARFDLDIVGIASPDVKGARFQFHIRRDPKAALLNIVVKSNDLRPPGKLLSLLDGWLKGENYRADVTSAESFDALRAGEMSWIDARDRWRAAGGEVRAVP